MLSTDQYGGIPMSWSENELAALLKEHPQLKVEGISELANQVSQAYAEAFDKKLLVGLPNNTHHARKTWSELCQRMFDSKAEGARGEYLWMLQKAGKIRNLEFQKTYVLSEAPKVTITLDFFYQEPWPNDPLATIWRPVHEDVKGERLTKKRRIAKPRVERDFNVKLAWLKQKFGISVRLYYG